MTRKEAQISAASIAPAVAPHLLKRRLLDVIKPFMAELFTGGIA
jgi:hypothetical protein